MTNNSNTQNSVRLKIKLEWQSEPHFINTNKLQKQREIGSYYYQLGYLIPGLAVWYQFIFNKNKSTTVGVLWNYIIYTCLSLKMQPCSPANYLLLSLHLDWKAVFLMDKMLCLAGFLQLWKPVFYSVSSHLSGYHIPTREYRQVLFDGHAWKAWWEWSWAREKEGVGEVRTWKRGKGKNMFSCFSSWFWDDGLIFSLINTLWMKGNRDFWEQLLINIIIWGIGVHLWPLCFFLGPWARCTIQD